MSFDPEAVAAVTSPSTLAAAKTAVRGTCPGNFAVIAAAMSSATCSASCAGSSGPFCAKAGPTGIAKRAKKALNERGWVEEMSGLREGQRRAEEMEGDVDWSDDEEVGVDEGEGELL